MAGNSNNFPLKTVIFILSALTVLVIWSRRPHSDSSQSEHPRANHTTFQQEQPVQTTIASTSLETAAPPVSPATAAPHTSPAGPAKNGPFARVSPAPSGSNVSSASAPDRVDPATQPRAFWSQPLEGLAQLPDGYAMDGLELTPRGVRLPASSSSQRSGQLLSPPLETDFPFNAITSLWKADLSVGTELLLEVSVSVDGRSWERWIDMLPDPDAAGEIAPTYPDGRPNPNYGFISGGLQTWGLTQWRWFRFRVTLSSSSQASPTLSGFRFYYQDTTLGKGTLTVPGVP